MTMPIFRLDLLHPFKMIVNVSTAVHDTQHSNRAIILRGNVEHQIVIDRHDAEIALSPCLSVEDSVPLRHSVEGCDCFFQSTNLIRCTLRRLKVKCDILENLSQVTLCLRSHYNGIVHTPNSLRISANACSMGIARSAFASA